MIAWVEGVLRERAPTRVVVDVGGVGYELHVPLSTFAALPEEGKTVGLRVYTHAREGAIQLFGFATPSERSAFDTGGEPPGAAVPEVLAPARDATGG